MRITFNKWQETKDTYEAWWAGELGRPVVNLYVVDPPAVVRERLGPPPALPYTRFTGQYDAGQSTESILDACDYELASRRYVADGFPSTWPNFGAGSLAAMTGCDMKTGMDTIWFEAPEGVTAGGLKIPSGTESSVARRIREFYRGAVELWGGAVQLGMCDLGGTLDILQSFFPSAGLSLELYDNPDEINRLIGEVHESWWAHFDAFQEIIAASNQGYTAWTPILSQESYYMLQCDFAYMIGPDMFDEFVLPELSDSCARLERPFYHLDGDGQLVHLDRILSIPGLAGVQWIPGEGAPDIRNWPPVYRKIRDAGKLTQIFLHQSEAGIDVLDVLAEQLGSLEGVAVVGEVTAGAGEEHAREVLARYGVPW